MKKINRLFIHAPNIHQGGGRSLLEALLMALPKFLNAVVVVDTRMPIPEGMHSLVEIKRVIPSVLERLKAEWWISQKVKSDDVLLSFGNLPPLFKLKGHVFVFLQNRYLVSKIGLGSFPFLVSLRLFIERLWFISRKINADEFIVQTPSMESMLMQLGSIAPIHVLPFVEQMVSKAKSNAQQVANCDFLYVASGEPHKNHRCLIEAWCLLAKNNLYPSLGLTLDLLHSQELCDWIDKKKNEFNLNINNFGLLSREGVKSLYSQSRALIYPSTFESFGLPLIEAEQVGLPILASELDYVRDIISPAQAFDPASPISIARAVKRFLGQDEVPISVMDAAGFLRCIIGINGKHNL